MEIGWPTDVRHVAHVTFDRFHGFLGLPVELEPEVPRRAPSASTKVFGVSTESMQCSYDSRGNSIPTILLLMQKRLYELGGLQTEGIFRITAENSQEEYVRDQLNSGKLPENIDVHCLSGLIKAWFRELPTGVLDSLSSEKVMQCRTEEDCTTLAGLLPPTEAALLDWAINLMVDVVQKEQQNKMNAHNVATVFAPNMTQMADPFTALMYAVQVMNFLRLLILKTLQERQEATLPGNATPSCDNIEASTQAATKPVCESPKEPPSTTLPPAPKEPSAASSLHTSQVVNAAQEKTAQSSAIKVDEPICENSEGSTNGARELTAATTNAIPVNSGGKPNEQNQSREEIRTN